MGHTTLPACMLLLLLLPTVHFSLLPHPAYDPSHAPAVLSDSGALYHAVEAPPAVVDLSDRANFGVVKLLKYKSELSGKHEHPPHTAHLGSSTLWSHRGEGSSGYEFPGTSRGERPVEDWYVLAHPDVSSGQTSQTLATKRLQDAFLNIPGFSGERQKTDDSFGQDLTFNMPKNIWHPYDVSSATRSNSSLHRSKRSVIAYPYNAVPLRGVTDHALSEKISSRVPPQELKRRLQEIYRLFLTDETTESSDVLQDTLNEFSKRGDIQILAKGKRNLNRLPKANEDDLTPTVYSELAEEEKQASDAALDDNQVELIGEEQPMDPYLIEYLETVRPAASSVPMGSRTSQSRWLDTSQGVHDLEPEEKEEEEEAVVGMDDVSRGGENHGGVVGGLPQGDVVMVHRRRKLSRAEQVRRLYDPSHLGPLARFALPHKGRGREGKAKKHPVALHTHLQQAQPLQALKPLKPFKPAKPSKPQEPVADNKAVTNRLRDCRRGDSAALRCPSDARLCLSDVMICDGVRDCPQGEDESPFLCMMRLWAFTLLNNVHAIFNSYVPPPQSRGVSPSLAHEAPRHQSRASYRPDRLSRQSGRPS